MRFQIQHSKKPNTSAWYGFDPFVGFFVTLEEDYEQVATYDAVTEGYNVKRPLLGALKFMVKEKFFGEDDLEAALVALEEDRPTRGRVKVAAEVVENFKAAADG
jgi:hypothetical protein